MILQLGTATHDHNNQQPEGPNLNPTARNDNEQQDEGTEVTTDQQLTETTTTYTYQESVWLYIYNSDCQMLHAHTVQPNEPIQTHVTPHTMGTHLAPHLMIPMTIHNHTDIHDMQQSWHND
eukprot:1367274-Prorocentrum_lima.AAC.1